MKNNDSCILCTHRKAEEMDIWASRIRISAPPHEASDESGRGGISPEDTPFSPDAGTVAANRRHGSGRLEATLDAWPRRGLVMKIASSKGARYLLHDAFFWFYRMPGYEGKSDEFNKEISPLLNKYYRDAMAASVHRHKHKGLRTIPDQYER